MKVMQANFSLQDAGARKRKSLMPCAGKLGDKSVGADQAHSQKLQLDWRLSIEERQSTYNRMSQMSKARVDGPDGRLAASIALEKAYDCAMTMRRKPM
jgi:hypothetical protein